MRTAGTEQEDGRPEEDVHQEKHVRQRPRALGRGEEGRRRMQLGGEGQAGQVADRRHGGEVIVERDAGERDEADQELEPEEDIET